jgi:hypothetical protein
MLAHSIPGCCALKLALVSSGLPLFLNFVRPLRTHMGKFHELEEFESTFDTMGVGLLECWKGYWTRHAQQLSPKARKQSLKRVRDIEKAIERKRAQEPPSPPIEIPETSRAPTLTASPTQKSRARAGRIMYIEGKAGGLTGPGRIGRVNFSQTGRTLHYGSQRFQRQQGFKSNYEDLNTGEHYWISGPKRRGGDALYGGSTPIEIDEDVREEYWRTIRRQPDRIHETVA